MAKLIKSKSNFFLSALAVFKGLIKYEKQQKRVTKT